MYIIKNLISTNEFPVNTILISGDWKVDSLFVKNNTKVQQLIECTNYIVKIFSVTGDTTNGQRKKDFIFRPPQIYTD
jgi:hypothetical protein